MHDRGAVLCLHGFSNTPYEMRPVAEALAARGYHVRAPAMAGHATRPEELAHTRKFAKQLIEFSTRCSDYFTSKGTPMPLLMGIQSNERTEAKVRLYRRHLPCIGAFFMYGHGTHEPAVAVA